jgi:hypothetical protein
MDRGRSRGKKGSVVEDLFLEMRSFRHLRSSSPPPGCASVFAICNREGSVSEYCWVPIGCAVFFFGLRVVGCFFGGWVRVMRSRGYGVWAGLRWGVGEAVNEDRWAEPLWLTCEVDGAERIALIFFLLRIEGLSS